MHYLEDALFEALLNRGHAVKVAELVSELTDLPVGVKMVKRALVGSDRFAMEDRRWNLAIRRMTDRPLTGALEYHLRAYGKPMALQMLANEMALVDKNPMSPAEYQSFLTPFLGSRPKFFATGDRWGLSEWLLDLRPQEDEQIVFLRNFFEASQETKDLAAQLAKARVPKGAGEVETALAVLAAAKAPVNTKLLSYVVWRLRGELEPQGFFEALGADERLAMLSGPLWLPQDAIAKVRTALAALSAQADLEEEVMPEGAEEVPVTVGPSDLEEMIAIITQRGHPTQVSFLAEAVFDVPPAKAPELAIGPINAAFESDGRLERVGVQTWALPEFIPEHIQDIPAELLVTSVLREDLEEDTDAELDDDGLESNLATWVHDPRYEDFGEEQEIELAGGEMTAEARSLEEIRYPLLYDHWRAGTMKIRESDTHFFPPESQLVNGIFRSEQGERRAWVNQFNTLVYDLRAWYEQASLVPGSVFTLSHGELPDDYRLDYTAEIDPLIAITPERVAELEALREPAETERWSVFEIMQRVMAEAKGTHFLTIWAEVNVVRRTSRRVVASNLSSYHAFFTRPANSDTWVYDDRKVSQGRKKAKRKYVRR